MVSKPKHHCGHIVSSGIGTLPSCELFDHRLGDVLCTGCAVGFENFLEQPVDGYVRAGLSEDLFTLLDQ